MPTASLNLKGTTSVTYDAIVVGTGISGGWAAKELTEKGLKTLVLERGRNVEHIKDYPTAMLHPWELKHGNKLTAEEAKHYPVQNANGSMRRDTKHWWVNDLEHPYEQIKPFSWRRGNHLGGRSLLWSRQCYRLSEMDFEANAREGIAIDWPIRYKDLAPWYDYVEGFAGISGQKEGLAQIPDGQFLPPMEMTCLEKEFKKRVEKKLNRTVTIGRTANLTQPHQGRGPCQFRNKCILGCPFGGYFSSNSATLPAAAATGNMTLRPDSVVTEIIFDDRTQRATGVRVIDANTHESFEYFAKIIFLNGSTLGTTAIMLNSISSRFPQGFGNDSGELGHNLMDHHHRVGAHGSSDKFSDEYFYGRRPNGIYIPRFRNLTEHRTDFIRGYGFQGGASRSNWTQGYYQATIGKELKAKLEQPGNWGFWLSGFGECLPYHENKVSLNTKKTDKWGMPLLAIDCEFKRNELAMRKDMETTAAEMMEAAGLKNINTRNVETTPGMGIHEMGTARMGRDPKTSVLNRHNQVHAATNVFVTDGSCMTSSACQNPSLTYMALTARAAQFAVTSLKKGEL